MVDDDDDTCELFSFALRQQGAAVTLASTAAAARAALEAGPIDVLMCDLSLADMNGADLAEEVRRRRAARVFVGVSGHAKPDHGSFDLYLQKPVDLTQLTESLASLVKSHPAPAIPESP